MHPSQKDKAPKPGDGDDVAIAPVTRVGVIGAGQMGRGIAQVAAAHGTKVCLLDVTMAQAEAAKATIAKAMATLVAKQKLTADKAEGTLNNITPAGDIKALTGVDLVIEAASEDEAIKGALFEQLDALLGADVILASNTSSISITRLAGRCRHPQRVVGMHFMNPVPLMPLVELIRGARTDAVVCRRTEACAVAWGKQVVHSQDTAGFIVNRVLMPMINEAAFALMEGVASAVDIDTAMRLGTNQPMGPLQLADFIGLDTCLAILEVMYRDLGDPKYRPCPLLKRMVASGVVGRKCGEGFHRY